MAKMTIKDYYNRFRKAQEKDFKNWEKCSAIEVALDVSCRFYFIDSYEEELDNQADKISVLICEWALNQKVGFKTALLNSGQILTNKNSTEKSFKEIINKLNVADYYEQILSMVNNDIENGIVYDDETHPTDTKGQLESLFARRLCLMFSDIEDFEKKD